MGADDDNAAWWDERARLHPDTALYRGMVADLEAHGHCLTAVERELVGDVAGQRVLHLQCHVGPDTLSWARLGAHVTGVDRSAPALEAAAALADRLGLRADWVVADARNLPDTLTGFDVVVTSWGVLGWLDRLDGWARGIAHALRPGGRFVLAEAHPAVLALDETQEDPAADPVVRFPMTAPPEPVRYDAAGSYAAPEAETSANRAAWWPHGVGEVLQALLDAGLVLERVEELDEVVWPALPCLVEVAPRRWVWPDGLGRVPLGLAVRARKG